jgi:hypothetical protein
MSSNLGVPVVTREPELIGQTVVVRQPRAPGARR